jgi:hypothetical protein
MFKENYAVIQRESITVPTLVIVMYKVWLLIYCIYSFICADLESGHQVTIFRMFPLNSCPHSIVMLGLSETFMVLPIWNNLQQCCRILSRHLIPSNLHPFKVYFNAGKPEVIGSQLWSRKEVFLSNIKRFLL